MKFIFTALCLLVLCLESNMAHANCPIDSHNFVIQQKTGSNADAYYIVLHTWGANCLGWHPASGQTIPTKVTNDSVKDYTFCESVWRNALKPAYPPHIFFSDQEHDISFHQPGPPFTWDMIVRGQPTDPKGTLYYENVSPYDQERIDGYASIYYKLKPGGNEENAKKQCTLSPTGAIKFDWKEVMPYL